MLLAFLMGMWTGFSKEAVQEEDSLNAFLLVDHSPDIQFEGMLVTSGDSLRLWWDKVEELFAAKSYDTLIPLAKKALRDPASLDYPVETTMVSRRLTRSYLNLGQYELALEYGLESLDWAERTKDVDLLVYQLCDIAVIYHDFEHFDKGVEYGKRALQIAKRDGADPWHQAISYNSIAINFDDWGFLDSALHYHFEVLKMNPMPDSLSISFTFNNIGNTLLKQEKWEEAERFLWISMGFNRQAANAYSLSSNFTNLGKVYGARGLMGDAGVFFDSALYYSHKSNSLEKVRDTYMDLSEFHEKNKDWKQALEFRDKYYSLRDSVFKVERMKTVNELEAKYQTALMNQKIMENELLLAKNEVSFRRMLIFSAMLMVIIGLLGIIHVLSRSRYRKKHELLEKEKEIAVHEAEIVATLASQEAEKKRFAKDLHDGFGQLITALRIHVNRFGSPASIEKRMETVEQSEQILDEMHREIRQIAFDMMPDTLMKLGVAPALKEFAKRLSVPDSVEITVLAFDMKRRLQELQEISIYRIVQEWCNNIIKYGNATTIEVQLVADDDEVSVTVEDNGEGFDTRILKQGIGYGWRNIQSRSKLIKAQLEVDSTPGYQGTTLMLSLKPVYLADDSLKAEKALGHENIIQSVV